MKKRTAVSYARYSSERQQESSIIVQLKEIHKYASDNGFVIIDDYVDEAQSGRTANRRSFQKMILDASLGKFDYIIVHRMDRWARNVEDAMHYKKMLFEFGIEIISVIEDFESTPEGDFFSLISMGMAELYSKRLTRECINGNLQNARMCHVHGGSVPLGYKTKGKKYVINRKEAKIVQLIFQMVADGHSYAHIRNTLNTSGYTYRGRKFTNHFHEMLVNRKYIGEYVYNRSVARKKNGTRNHHESKPESEIIRIPNGMPRIISDELFMQVQDIIQKRKRNNGRQLKRGKNLLSGLLVCGYCKSAICGANSKEGRYKYQINKYMCRGPKMLRTCKCKPVVTSRIDTYIYEILTNAFLEPTNTRALCNIISHALDKKHDENIDKMTEIQKQIDEIEHNLADMNDSKDSSYSSRSRQIILTAIEGYNRELKALTAELNTIQHEDIHKTKPYTLTVREKMKSMQTIMKYRERESMKDMIRTLVNQITITNEVITTQIKLNNFLENYPTELYVTVVEVRDNIALLDSLSKQNLSMDTLVLQY